MIVLAIESTCDETGAAVAKGYGEPTAVEILSDVKASSAEILSKYGGVIPEIAAREQVASIVPVIQEAIEVSSIKYQVSSNDIEAIAVTQGPGLIGSLLIGVETAKTLALAWKKPLIAVNHMAGHVFANWIKPSTGSDTVTRWHGDTPELSSEARSGFAGPAFPVVALIVSGGHTDLMLLNSLTDWKWIGGTRDDAAGEAFDKAARAMGLPYPGGPAIAKMAMQKPEAGIQKPEWMKLPRPMIHEDNLEMSFSGLKTALVQVVGSPAFAEATARSSREQVICALAREFNEAVVEVLVKKTMMAVEIYKPRSVLLAGGVAANALLRESLKDKVESQKLKLFVPELKYCTDNAAMIAACALLRPDYIDPLKLRPNPSLEIA